jgi:hypothetical protein
MPAVQYRDGGEIFGNLTVYGRLSASNLCGGGGGGGSGPYVAGSGTCSIQAFTDTNNNASGNYSTIVNGFSSTASGLYSIVNTGLCNKASGQLSTILNGSINTASGYYSVVNNGTGNTSSGNYGTILNGYFNNATEYSSIVGSGDNNLASGILYSTVINGANNCANACYSSVINGYNNVIATGHNYSTIAGTGIASVSACMLHVNMLYAANLPTSNPGVPGVVWNDGGTLKIST